MKKYYSRVNYRDIGFIIQEAEILQEKRTHFFIKPTTIWKWGTIEDDLEQNRFCSKSRLSDTLEDAVASIYQGIEQILIRLKDNKERYPAHILELQAILREEKQLAKQAERNYVKFSNILSNLNIEKQLERKGLL